MKSLTPVLFIIVVLFSAFFYLKAKNLPIKIDNRVPCMLLPNGECVNALKSQWTSEQKALYRHLLDIDFLYIFFYTALLGFWSYLEMQCQRNFFINNLLRFAILLVLIAALADVTENFFHLQYAAALPIDYVPGSYLPTLIKWGSIALILTTLAISVLLRKVVRTDRHSFSHPA